MKRFFIFILISLQSWGQKNKILYESRKEPFFEVKEIFFGERFPNVVVSKDGSIIASWGKENFIVRRSEDGGETWGPKINICKGIN